MLLLVHTASPMKSKAFNCAFWPARTRGLKIFQHSECCFTQHCWQGRMFFHKTSGCIFHISNIFQNNAKQLVQDTLHVQLWPNSTTNKIPTSWLSLPSQFNSTHTNHHTSTSLYNIFLSSVTYYIWRVASLPSVAVTGVWGGKKYIQELLVLHACWTSTIRLRKDFTWWTVCVCVYACTRVVLCLQCSCTLKLADKLHALCLELHIHYFHYLFKKVPLVMTELCAESINSDAPTDMNINDQGTTHPRSEKNDMDFPRRSN